MRITHRASRLRERAPRRSGHHAPSLSWQAICFAAVGASGTALTFLLLTILHKGFGWRVELANILAYSAGIVNNYVWNRVWTFRHVARRNVLHQGGQFVAVSLGGLVINTIMLSLLLHNSVNYLVAFGAAALLAYGWNFYMNHRVTFRHGHPPAALHALTHLHRHGDHNAATVPGDGD